MTNSLGFLLLMMTCCYGCKILKYFFLNITWWFNVSLVTWLKLYYRVYLSNTSDYALWLIMFLMFIKGHHF